MSGVSQTIQNNGVDKVDLLLAVDNSNSMRENQENIGRQFGLLIKQKAACGRPFLLGRGYTVLRTVNPQFSGRNPQRFPSLFSLDGRLSAP